MRFRVRCHSQVRHASRSCPSRVVLPSTSIRSTQGRLLGETSVMCFAKPPARGELTSTESTGLLSKADATARSLERRPSSAGTLPSSAPAAAKRRAYRRDHAPRFGRTTHSGCRTTGRTPGGSTAVAICCGRREVSSMRSRAFTAAQAQVAGRICPQGRLLESVSASVQRF